MTDPVWVISSSVLILAVIAIRAILGKRMSAGLRYALWGLVLLRLLIPGTVFSSPVSVKSAVIKAPVVSDIEAVRRVSSVSMDDEGVVTGRLAGAKPPEEAYPYASSVAYPVELVLEEKATPERFESLRRTVEARDIMNIVWYCGMAALALRFIFANTRAYLDLRRRREPIPADAPCRVYAVDGISSSCLFMGAVYVSKQTALDGHELKNVLAHELAHRRHGDGVTVFLRSAALILHWYNPLVWAAAYISRRDGELFADAGAIKALGEDERESYGMTLIGLSSKLKKRVGLSVAATTMTGGKRELKERITHMAKNTKMRLVVAALVLALALAAVGCTFMGGKAPVPDDASEPTESPAPAATEKPEPTEPPAVTDVPRSEATLDTVYESNYYEYLAAAQKLLAGENAEKLYENDVYFHLDDDAFRAYAKQVEYQRRTSKGNIEYSFEYEDPIAEYPREVGEKALNRLYTEIPWLDYVGPYTQAEGFVGDDWFVLKTVDDSMQDIQFSVIFRRDENGWYEFGDNNSQQFRPLFGACIVDENVGFLSYFTKFYDEPDGSYRKIWLYRTDDGGKTWVDMGLVLPEEYGMSYPGYGASPVFDGDHGVMPVCAHNWEYDGSNKPSYDLMYETFDGGKTWTLRDFGTPDWPSEAWLLEEGWKLAEEVGRIHGVQFDKDEHDIRKSSIPSNNGYHGEVSIHFFGDEANLWIYYVDDYNGNWPEHITMDMCLLDLTSEIDDIDEEKWLSDRDAFSWPTLTVSRNELESAGYTFSDDGEAANCAAYYYGDQIVKMFTECPEDNYFRCYEAVNVEIAPNDYVPDFQTHLATLAVRPVNERYFLAVFGDILEALYGGDEYPECRGWYTIWYGIMVTDNGDGTFNVTYNFGA